MIRIHAIGDTGEVPMIPSIHAGIRLSRRTQAWTVAVAIFNAVIALGIFLDEQQFQASIYRIHRQVMPLEIWGIFWALGAVFYLLTAWTRSVRLWIFTSVVGITYSACWAMCILVAKLANEPITPNGLALWAFVLFAQTFSVMSPLSVEIDGRTNDVRSG